MSFSGQIAIVTGASSGIGWSLCKELARQGAKVGLVARRREQLDTLAREIRDANGTASVAVADVADREGINTAIRGLIDELGGVDLLIANAGVGAPTAIEPFNMDDIEKMYRVNVFGVIYSIEAVIPHMLAKGKGHITGVSSMASYKGLPGEWAYSSSKAALNNILEGLRIQLRERGIYVTNICPGFIQTPMVEKNKFDMPFLIQADDAARRILRALTRKKKVFNFPWQMNLLMGLVARLPDWLVARQMKQYNEDPPWPDKPI